MPSFLRHHVFLGLLLLVGVSACKKDDDGEDDPVFILTSSALVDGRLHPDFKCEKNLDGVQLSIPLAWENVPEGTQSMAIIMRLNSNADEPVGVTSQLLLWGIAPSVTAIPHGQADDGPWFMGANEDGTAISYTSPCWTSPGTREYEVTLYALASPLSNLPQESSLAVDYETLASAINSTTVTGEAKLTFLDVTN